MNYHHGHPGRTVVKATSFILKWTLTTLLILTIGLTTIPASTNPVQREEAILRHHETIHHLDAGPTSSPLTKAMKVLLHHLPARRSERVDHDNTHGLTVEMDDVQEAKEHHEASHGLISHDRESLVHSEGKCTCPPPFRNQRCRCPPGAQRIQMRKVAENVAVTDFRPSDPSPNLADYQLNERDVKDGTPSNLEIEHHKTSHDAIGHDNTGHLYSTIECFYKSTGRWKLENARTNIAYNGHKGMIEGTVKSSPLHRKPGDPSDFGSDIEAHERERLDGPSKFCKCGPHNRKCRCYHNKDPSVERSQVKKETEKVAIDAMSHFRSSDPSSKLADYQPNEREVKDGTLDGKSGQSDPSSELNMPVKHGHKTHHSRSMLCPCGQYYQQCRYFGTKLPERGNLSQFQSKGSQINPETSLSSTSSSEREHEHHSQSTNSQTNSKPSSTSRPSKSSPDWRTIEHNFAVQSKGTEVEHGTHSNSGNDKEKDDLGRVKQDPRSTSCHCNGASPGCGCGEFLQLGHLQAKKKRQHFAQCRCDVCTGRSWIAHRLCYGRWSRDLVHCQNFLEDHATFNEKCSCNPKNATGGCGIQRPHIVIHEGEPDLTTDLAKASGVKAEESGDFNNPEHNVNEKVWRERWSGSFDARASQNMHLDPLPADSIITPKRDVTTQLCGERWWLRRPNCRPRSVHTSKAEEVHNDKFYTSGHNDENIIQSKQQVDGLDLSTPDSIIAKDDTCHKLWRVNTGCLPKHRAKLGTAAKHSHHLSRRSNTLLESINEARCQDKLGRAKEKCEENNRIGFWMVCSILAVAGICGLLLGIIILHIHLRRKRPSQLLISNRSGYKSGASTPATSVSEMPISKVGRPASVMRRIDEDENVETSSVRRYTTLDGANDGWTSWIRKQTGRAKVSQT